MPSQLPTSAAQKASKNSQRLVAELAQLGQVTRTRVCQILMLTNLAPAIQEALLFLPKMVRGPERITENRENWTRVGAARLF